MKSILYTCYLFASVLLLSELLCRVARLAPKLEEKQSYYVEAGKVPYKLKPFYRSTSGNVLYEANSVGMRDTEHSFLKTADTFRILGLGDSFTQGVGVNLEDSYLYKLEKQLNGISAELAKVEIIKAGIAGYGPTAERLMLEHVGLHYEPNIVVIGFVPNDIIDTHYGTQHVRGGYLVTPAAAELGDWVMASFIRSHVARLLVTSYLRFEQHTKGDEPPMSWADVYRSDGVHEDDWRTIENEYATMAKLAKLHGALPVFLHIPFHDKFPHPGAWENTALYPAQRLQKLALENGAQFVDALPLFRNARKAGTQLYIPDDGHCNATGYGLIAEALATKFIEQKWIPSSHLASRAF